ncbi:sushi, von Willebrand factor type A, EGF and pentraxin domain-containing protein 1-like [Chaetodon trifascialis]|uniref:sushi, von Willebrand factor type A, EGF and pentraxin domain-containing protein 1-like n=1 Tax=Chaetodon trifascialis TaxID=109706 RepID=UPI003992B465
MSLPGWFQELSGQRECNPCPPGFHCQALSPSPTSPLPCPAGYICPRGSPDSRPLPCPKGTYSPSQGLTTTGTFSFETGNTHQSNCTTCTPGYYCQVEGTVQPAQCPIGYYCPPGLTLGLEFPCPPGTVQSQLGASSPEACLLCPAGMFCSQPGQSRPTGLCEAGFYCPAGSTSPNSTEYQGNSTRSLLCPSGHYCPSGAGYPLPCPIGSLSISRGLKRDDECPPCPPGMFCDRPAIAELSDALPCHAGYVCLGGSSSPTPSDGPHGYLCPTGHSCPPTA